MLLILTANAFAQSRSNDDWTRIKDDKTDFSISFPSNFLVDNEVEKSYIMAPVLASLPELINTFEKPRIIGNKGSVVMSLSVFQLRQVSEAKNYLWYYVGGNSPQASYQDFRAGDFVGRKTTYDGDKTQSTSIAIAVKSKVFLIYASGKKEDAAIYEKFVTSLMLNGKPLFKTSTNSAPDAPRSVFVSNLQTSPEILEILNRKDDQPEVKVVKSALTAQKEDKPDLSFSRPLILLRKPMFDFIDIASKNRYSGLVKLKVNFLANGKIGDIEILSDASDDITKLAVRAAQKIRFLPAEIDGKKVDAAKTIEYAFNIR